MAAWSVAQCAAAPAPLHMCSLLKDAGDDECVVDESWFNMYNKSIRVNDFPQIL